MSTGKPRDPDKERFWRRTLGQRQHSGLGIAELCRQQGLSAANFYAWRRILAQRDLEAVAFVPVRVRTETIADVTDSVATGLELVLKGGRWLRIGPAFDDATLRRVLTVLEEGRPCS